MIFKRPHMAKQLSECSSDLNAVAQFMDRLSRDVCKKEIIITRVSDAVEGESGVHPAKRAFDCRFQTEGGYYYTEEDAEYICDKVNERFPRTDGKVTCMIHSFNGGMEHFHVQIGLIVPKDWNL